MKPEEYAAALGVLAKSDSSDEDKAAAIEKLTAFGESMFDEKDEDKKEEEKSSDSADEKKDDEKSSEAADDKKDEDKMASAIAKALEPIVARLSKIEKASAIGGASRAAKPTVIPRKEPAAPPDPVSQMIDGAIAASRRSAGRK